MKIDRQLLTNAEPQEVANATYAIINALQHYPAHIRALAAACHIKLTTELRGVSPQDILTPADNLMSSPEGQYRRTEFRAARDYMTKED